MNVYIQLTSAGTETGPFNLYSNVDGYIVAFETGVSKATLLAGYTSVLVPDGSSIIRIISTSDECPSQVNLTISTITPTTSTTSTSTTSTSSTTTTTTTASIPCNEYCYEGIYNEGDEVHPDGGTLIYIDCNGVEQTIVNIWIETGIVSVTAQSIVSNIACFLTDCTTTTTTTLYPPTTTTTTTGAFSVQIMLIARSLGGTNQAAASDLCNLDYNDAGAVDLDTLSVVYFLSNTTIPTISDVLYIDYALTIPFTLSDGTWWGAVTNWSSNTMYDYTVEINSSGVILSTSPCEAPTTTTTTTI